jgi:serine/threonine protein kinase
MAWVLANRRRLRALTRLGQYRVDGEIGRGSMGVVYRAQHLLLGRPAALKLLAGNLVDAGSRARFEREVRLAAKLQHPSIVAVYDFGVTAEGLFFYAMELLDGVTVRELVADGPVPGRARRRVSSGRSPRRCARPHDKQIVHRDLAPANLMITVRGNQHDVVKILDFGLVKRIRTVAGDPDAEEPQSETGVIIGTPGFIAPEVLRGRAADERVDIYALGCIWYGLLAGQFPYRGATPDARRSVPSCKPPRCRCASWRPRCRSPWPS